MIQTSFSKNWNGKLLMPYFGTIRLYNAKKYYLGAEHEIVLNDTFLGVATIAAMRELEFQNIMNSMTFLDSVMPADKFKGMLYNMYKNKAVGGVHAKTLFMHVIFHWEKREMKAQEHLIKIFWDKLCEDQADLFLGR